MRTFGFWARAARLMLAAGIAGGTALWTGSAPSVTPAHAAPAAECQGRINIDAPQAEEVVGGIYTVSGWAVDPAGEGTGVSSVEVALNAPPGEGGIPVGTATYGVDRSDVADFLGDPRFARSGWSVSWDTATMAPGSYTLYVVAKGSCGTTTQTLPVTVGITAEPPPLISGKTRVEGCITLEIDLPAAGQLTEAPLLVVGYAYDPNRPGEEGVSEIKVYLGPKEQGKLVATPRYGLARQDLQSDPATEAHARSGFSGLVLPHNLPATGEVMLYVYATGPCGEVVAQVPVQLTTNTNLATIAPPKNPQTLPTPPPLRSTSTTTATAGTGGTANTAGSTPPPPAGTPATPANSALAAMMGGGAGAPAAPAGTAPTTPPAPATPAIPPTNSSLGAPANLTATQTGSAAITLSWTAPSSGTIERYAIYQSTDGSTFTSLGVVPAGQTSTTISNLTDGTSYWFYVVAQDASGASGAESNRVGPLKATGGFFGLPTTGAPPGGTTPPPATQPPATTPPPGGTVAPPTNVAFTSAAADQGTVTWAPSPTPGITGYQVYVSIDGQPPVAIGAPTAATATSLALQSLVPGHSYTFHVVALAGGAQSAPSNTIGPCQTGQPCTTTGVVGAAQTALQLPAPANVQVSWPAGTTTATVTWTPTGGANLTGYIVQWTNVPGGAPLGQQNVPGATTTTATIGPLQPGTTYYITVRAVDAANNQGLPSAPAAALPGALPGAAPGTITNPGAATPPQLTATAGTNRSVNLTWTAVAGASAYRIYRAAPGSAALPVGGTDAATLTYTDTSIILPGQYTYHVTALVNTGETAPSNQVTVSVN